MLAAIFSIFVLTFSVGETLAQSSPDGDIVESQIFRNGRRIRAKGNERSRAPRHARLTAPIYSGTGCPADTASVSLSPDNKTLSLLFDDFIVEAGGATGLHRTRKSCQIVVPFDVEPGYQVAVVALDYRGYNFIPEGGRVEVRSAHSFQSNRGRRSQRVGSVLHRAFFEGPVDDEYILSGEVASRDVWSPCGRDINLNIRTTVSAGTNSFGEDLLTTVDSLDVASNQNITDSQLEYHLLWRECDQNTIGSPRPHPRPRRPVVRPRRRGDRPSRVLRPQPRDSRPRVIPPRRPRNR